MVQGGWSGEGGPGWLRARISDPTGLPTAMVNHSGVPSGLYTDWFNLMYIFAF